MGAHTLVPRADTETLVQWIKRDLESCLWPEDEIVAYGATSDHDPVVYFAVRHAHQRDVPHISATVAVFDGGTVKYHHEQMGPYHTNVPMHVWQVLDPIPPRTWPDAVQWRIKVARRICARRAHEYASQSRVGGRA